MTKKLENLGFIGAGRMATALATGAVTAGLVDPAAVVASDPSQEALRAFTGAVAGAKVSDENAATLAGSRVVFLSVKPQKMDAALAEVSKGVTPDHLLISIAAGVRLEQLAAALPAGTRLVRVMPNTPCLVGMGASCYCLGPDATAADAETVEGLLASVGKAYAVEEAAMDAVTGLSGSGPAFVYSMVEALAQGGVDAGLEPELALALATQTTRGAAEMLFATGYSPAELREQVMSPGGTTVAGIQTLTQRMGADAFAAAVASAAARSQELGQ
ncbi:MAG: pyrroline-5-carboxylate reductase [Planctomycetota bacterium]